MWIHIFFRMDLELLSWICHAHIHMTNGRYNVSISGASKTGTASLAISCT